MRIISGLAKVVLGPRLLIVGLVCSLVTGVVAVVVVGLATVTTSAALPGLIPSGWPMWLAIPAILAWIVPEGARRAHRAYRAHHPVKEVAS